jgi:hypothetical protein
MGAYRDITLLILAYIDFKGLKWGYKKTRKQKIHYVAIKIVHKRLDFVRYSLYLY